MNIYVYNTYIHTYMYIGTFPCDRISWYVSQQVWGHPFLLWQLMEI